MPRRRSRILIVPLLCACASAAAAQERALARYHHLLPPMPTIVGETDANRALHVFGDSAAADYRDIEPRDGIDDVRAARLLRLAAEFSPILRRNNFTVPVDFARVRSSRAALHVDIWLHGDLASRDSTMLLPARAEPGDTPPIIDAADTLLAALVRRHHPARRVSVLDPGDRRSIVLYIDLPGAGERSWREAYQDTRMDERRIFAHPFLERTGERYRFVLQYWLFYPFNDGPNNHEGDWEHLNVVVAWPRGGAERADLLDASDVARVLSSDSAVLDSLEIGFVEYYFHESVVVLDYQGNARARPASIHPFEDPDWLGEVVARRRSLANGRLARHPFAYIGANPTGPDELFAVVPRFTGSYNRNPHGTYPAPGLWQHVGAMGSTERVQGPVTPHVHDDAGLPWHELIADSAWVTFPESRIILVPDWERVADLALHEDEVARRWGWLFLPIRFGFPIARSPGAGLVPHADLGNISPEGPAYQSTWNRLSAEGAPERYEPTVVRIALVSTTPWTAVQSGWGALNMPLFAAGLMPGYHVFLSQAMPWLTSALEVMNMPPPRTYYRGALPVRFSSLSGGVSRDQGGEELSAVIPVPAATAGASPRSSTLEREPATLFRVGVSLYDGRRIAVENTFEWGSSGGTYQLADSTGSVGFTNASIGIRELRGGFRYALLMLPEGAARLDARAGYGWMRYTAEHARLERGDERIAIGEGTGGYLPSILPSRRWWPNTWWVGLGLELFTPRNFWLQRTAGYGLRCEAAFAFHRLGEEVSAISGSDYSRRLTSSCSVVLGW